MFLSENGKKKSSTFVKTIILLLLGGCVITAFLVCLYLKPLLSLMGKGLDLLSVPPDEIVRQRLSAFLPCAGQIEVLYSYHDVDSMIVRYRVDSSMTNSNEALAKMIKDNAAASGWKQILETDDEMHFLQVRQLAWGYSVAEVRVNLGPDSTSYLVGWLEADSRRPVASMEETYEGKVFGTPEFWPRFERLSNQ